MKYWVVIAHSYLQTGPSLGWDPGGGVVGGWSEAFRTLAMEALVQVVTAA